MERFQLSPQTLFLISIAVVTLIGLVVVYRLRRDVVEDDGSTSPDDILKDLERAYFAGEMDEAEFRRVTASIEAKKAKADRPPAKVIVPEPTTDAPTDLL